MFSLRSAGAGADVVTVVAALGIANACIVGASAYTWWLYKDLLRGRVLVVEGLAGPGMPGHVRSMAVAGLLVPIVTREQAAALQRGRSYRVAAIRGPNR
ncbi:MAG: hypothetical protein R2712_01545 [Vicinamibacterales bacterium]